MNEEEFASLLSDIVYAKRGSQKEWCKKNGFHEAEITRILVLKQSPTKRLLKHLGYEWVVTKEIKKIKPAKK